MKTRSPSVYRFVLIAIAFSIMAMAGNVSKNDPPLRSSMPAGYDVITLKPSGAHLSLMGLVECPEIEGARHVPEGGKTKLIRANGRVVEKFPQHFNFRITASLRKLVLQGPAIAVDVSDNPQDLLLKLRFRIKAYNGLEMHEITPKSIEMIGVPADVPYDERVYRISINAGQLPITDRIVIEILSPQGELLTHFPFSLI
jgi:hypothetical protein